MIQKYRAWHKKEKKMLKVECIDFQNKLVWLKGLIIGWKNDGIKFKDVIFRQSIGKKDKNGKEIFEGDIVKIKVKESQWAFSEVHSKYTIIDEVKFVNGCFVVGCLQMDTKLCSYDSKQLEVIGNIHKNPKLLERI